MPCKGNGWYSRIILEYLIKNEIEHSVLYEIKALKTLKPSHFAPFVDEAMRLCPDAFKHITNTFCGSLNTHTKKIGKHPGDNREGCSDRASSV
jgi:hypothetical protein